MLDGQEYMILVGRSDSGREAVESFRRLRPDVTLMDLAQPRHAFGVVRPLRTVTPRQISCS